MPKKYKLTLWKCVYCEFSNYPTKLELYSKEEAIAHEKTCPYRPKKKKKKKQNELIENIWYYKQNKPTYIVRDITERYPYVNEDFLYSVLLKRGVFKWFAVRRELIKLKNEWKNTIKLLQSVKKTTKRKHDYKKYNTYKGAQRQIEMCRKEIRNLCHSDRLQAPDNDPRAINFLKKLKGEQNEKPK